MSRDQVAAFRLARQHLEAHGQKRALLSVVRDMAGAQAQVLSAAQISLWARVRALRPEDVEIALRERTLIKAWCMRHTLHLIPASEAAVFVRGSAGRAERDIRWIRGQGVSDRAIEAVIDAALRMPGSHGGATCRGRWRNNDSYDGTSTLSVRRPCPTLPIGWG